MDKLYKRSLAMEFHNNSEPPMHPQSFDPKIQYKIYPNAKAISLEMNDFGTDAQIDDTFLKALGSRISTRAFSGENVDLDTLSKLLTLACGLKHHDSFNRTYASAGGRYPIEVYIAILRSNDLEKGIYHYNIKRNALELIKQGDYSEKLIGYYENQNLSTDFPCIIFLSAVFQRTMDKYSDRGYRYMLLDAGHMGQNLYLTATYLSLGILGIGRGDVRDKEFDKFLGLVSDNESLIYSFIVGHPQI